MRRNDRCLYRIARGALRDETEAEDAVQAAYVKACGARMVESSQFELLKNSRCAPSCFFVGPNSPVSAAGFPATGGCLGSLNDYRSSASLDDPHLFLVARIRVVHESRLDLNVSGQFGFIDVVAGLHRFEDLTLFDVVQVHEVELRGQLEHCFVAVGHIGLGDQHGTAFAEGDRDQVVRVVAAGNALVVIFPRQQIEILRVVAVKPILELVFVVGLGRNVENAVGKFVANAGVPGDADELLDGVYGRSLDELARFPGIQGKTFQAMGKSLSNIWFRASCCWNTTMF
jgi:hypothetical protein